MIRIRAAYPAVDVFAGGGICASRKLLGSETPAHGVFWLARPCMTAVLARASWVDLPAPVGSILGAVSGRG